MGDYKGQHRNPDQPGDRAKVLKAGQRALIKIARQQGISNDKIQAARTDDK